MRQLARPKDGGDAAAETPHGRAARVLQQNSVKKSSTGKPYPIKIHRNYITRVTDTRFCPVYWTLLYLQYSGHTTGRGPNRRIVLSVGLFGVGLGWLGVGLFRVRLGRRREG